MIDIIKRYFLQNQISLKLIEFGLLEMNLIIMIEKILILHLVVPLKLC